MGNNILDSTKLAVNGGEPVRKKPFASACFMSGKEKELLLECLESNRWSSFLGASPGWDIKEDGRYL